LYNEQRQLFADKTQQDAEKFVEIGDSPPDQEFEAAEIAALTVTCQAILNLDATIFER
jgi:hypothetical protein